MAVSCTLVTVNPIWPLDWVHEQDILLSNQRIWKIFIFFIWSEGSKKHWASILLQTKRLLIVRGKKLNALICRVENHHQHQLFIIHVVPLHVHLWNSILCKVYTSLGLAHIPENILQSSHRHTIKWQPYISLYYKNIMPRKDCLGKQWTYVNTLHNYDDLEVLCSFRYCFYKKFMWH